MFMKLLKDENAVMRSKADAFQFLNAMISFESKPELLGLLDDDRHCGPLRVKEVLTFMDDARDVIDMLIPILSCLVNKETSRPLYKRPRNRMISCIHNIAGIYSMLSEEDVIALLPSHSTNALVSYLEIAVMTIAEARSSFEVKKLVRRLVEKKIEGTEKLCALLLLQGEVPAPVTQSKMIDSSFNNSDNVACWVSDKIEPGGRHDNDFKNFRDIQIVPTHDEILCETSPWLPLASHENSFIEDKEMRMLDANFRLLREDALYTMKNNIQERKRIWENARIIGFTHHSPHKKCRQAHYPLE
jgi:hypothetical protein